MQRANLSASRSIFLNSTWVGCSPGGTAPFGSRSPHAVWAAGYRGLLAAICSSWLFGSTPLRLGSGKVGMPFERMQREKASAPFSCTDAGPALEEELLRVAVVPTCAT
jgi:hypothetical protein